MAPRPESRDELARLLEAIVADSDRIAGPFDETRLPEKHVLREIDARGERARFLTLTASINYEKETAGEDGLWWVCKRLLDDRPGLFIPEVVVDRGEQAVVDAFASLEMMTPADPWIWFQIAATLHRRFDGDVLALLAAQDHDAVVIREFVREHGDEFPSLKDRTITALWLGLVHEEVHELERMQAIPLPVDSRLRSITARLLDEPAMGREANTGIVETFWQSVCEEYDVVPVRMYKPLWVIETDWNEWGQDYLAATLEDVR